MKRLRYAGGSILVGDAVSHALLTYARDLARAATSDTVSIHGLTDEGADDEAEMLIGPASQLFADTADGPEALPGDTDTVTEIEKRRASLRPGTVRLEDQQNPGERDWLSDWAVDGHGNSA